MKIKLCERVNRTGKAAATMEQHSQKNEWRQVILLHLALLLGTALWVAVALGFRIYCPIRHVTGIPCPGCGMSRALVSLLRLNWQGYWHNNPAALPCLTAVFVLVNRETVLLRRLPMWVKDGLIGVGFGLTLLTYLVRLIWFDIP